MPASPISGKDWSWYRGEGVFLCQCGRYFDASIQNCIVWKKRIWHAACAMGYAYKRIRVAIWRPLPSGQYEFVRFEMRDRWG